MENEIRCRVIGCTFDVFSAKRGLCRRHYMKAYSKGGVDVLDNLPDGDLGANRSEFESSRKPRLCPEDGCEALARQSKCPEHTKARKKHSAPPGGRFAVHAGETWRRYITPKGYVMAHRLDWSERILEHRLVLGLTIGRSLLPHEEGHHLNGVRTDNRPENLELWTTSQPSGSKVEDKVNWAKEMLALYEPSALS